MSEGEFLVRMAVVVLIAVSGLVRAIAALISEETRQSVARYRVAHTFWFVGSALALLVLLREFFPARANERQQERVDFRGPVRAAHRCS